MPQKEPKSYGKILPSCPLFINFYSYFALPFFGLRQMGTLLFFFFFLFFCVGVMKKMSDFNTIDLRNFVEVY